MKSLSSNFLLVLHFAWAAWMVAGIVLAAAGFVWKRLWRWRLFRITHLIGILATATVPFWAGGICPLTEWEWRLRIGGTGSASPEPFIVHWMREVLFIDLDPFVLSLAAGFGAAFTLVVFILHPPRRR